MIPFNSLTCEFLTIYESSSTHNPITSLMFCFHRIWFCFVTINVGDLFHRWRMTPTHGTLEKQRGSIKGFVCLKSTLYVLMEKRYPYTLKQLVTKVPNTWSIPFFKFWSNNFSLWQNKYYLGNSKKNIHCHCHCHHNYLDQF